MPIEENNTNKIEEKYEFNAPMFVDLKKTDLEFDSDIPTTAYGSENKEDNVFIVKRRSTQKNEEVDRLYKKKKEKIISSVKSKKPLTCPVEFKLGEKTKCLQKFVLKNVKKREKKTTKPIPFSFPSDNLPKKKEKNVQAKKEFKAKPVPKEKPFITKKSFKKTTIPTSPKLKTEKRIEKRKEFVQKKEQ